MFLKQDPDILGITEDDLLWAIDIRIIQRYQVRNGEELLTNLEERGFIESSTNGLEEITSIMEIFGEELENSSGGEQQDVPICGDDSLTLQGDEISILEETLDQ